MLPVCVQPLCRSESYDRRAIFFCIWSKYLSFLQTARMDISKGPTRLEPDSIYPPNSSGFPALPDSVHLQILSHFPTYQIPNERSGWQQPGCSLRHRTLQSLSSTCRSLRKFYSKYLWEQIEVHSVWRYDERRIAWALLGNWKR